MKVLLLGATGFTGKAVLSHLLSQEKHEVTILVRSKAKIKTKHPKLNVIEGNVAHFEALKESIGKQDAVINCVGKNKGNADDFISSITKKIVDTMEELKVDRYIALSNVGAGDSYKHQPWIFRRVLLPTILKWLKLLIDDKNVMEPMIRKSNLNWTILRFPNIVDRAARNRVLISQDGRGLSFKISLEDCAKFIISQLEDKSLWFKSPSISN